ncbi:MAG TPA: serine/threonine-protein kinase [Holophagaceae bacterium]|nr:serine/threonine-protein kinase [Holophagaceae bacterium]
MRTRIGKFEILRPLGKGAMGEVFLAVDPLIGRHVAIKTIRGVEAEGAEARGRFQREAQAAGQLNHPNLVGIHEFGEDDGLLYLAMEYVEGEDLEKLLARGGLQPQELLEVLAQVCDGLAYAHGKGVLHRDIKPSNVRVLKEGGALKAKIMDFGIARLHNSELTGTGTLLGTFGYMAPEYVQTGKPDPRSDLFAVGVMLYEALAGHRPFEGDTTATVLYRLVHEEPAALDLSRLQGVSAKLNQVLAVALAKDPRARFQGGEALAKALREAKDPTWGGPDFDRTQAVAKPAIPAPAAPTPQPTRSVAAPTPAGRKGPWVAVILLLLGGGGGAAWWFTRPKVVPTISLPPPEPAAGPGSAPAKVAGPVEAPREKAEPRPRPAAHAAKAKVEPPLTEEEANAWLNEAGLGLVDTPEQSLKRIERVIQDHPLNPRARALQLAGLYNAGRYDRMVPALEGAKDAGVPPRQLLAFGAFQDMLRTEKREQRLPPAVKEMLGAEFPGIHRAGQRFSRPLTKPGY